ncbi:hypothetical protein [Exiguobacterium sp. 17-1]|uniref:hypothetical protein n=1 Tax=Exiguobacterium sp. 17-1 TaxID=2931981 RepID=UPI001FFFF570|nr:hypothetical protein [Exiguobacterium sp. 17-1]MCK2157510.1 hypothetical protein [Exiguobacterium sp. 17-1]
MNVKNALLSTALGAVLTVSLVNGASAGRQFFSDVNSVTSKDTSSKGKWTQSGYSTVMIDGGRTYDISVGGKFSSNGVISTHNIPVEFYCSETGVVS